MNRRFVECRNAGVPWDQWTPTTAGPAKVQKAQTPEPEQARPKIKLKVKMK